MKAAVLEELNSPLTIKDVPIPQAGADGVLVKVKQCGICVTDVRIASGARPVGKLPFIMGHEGVGVVQEVGDKVSYFKKGDRVLMDPLVSCGQCLNCNSGRENLCEHRYLIGISPGMQGVYAEYGVIPQRNLFILPENVSFSDGVLITSNLASAFHGVRRVDFKPSESACIYGFGALGKMVSLILRAYGASLIIAVARHDDSLKGGHDFGADYLINSTKSNAREKILELTKGRGVDVGFEVAGKHDAILSALECTRSGGRTCILGVPFYRVVMDFKSELGFFQQVCEKEATILDSWGYLRQEFPIMLKLISKNIINLSPCRTKLIPLEKVNEGLKLNQEGIYTRVIIDF